MLRSITQPVLARASVGATRVAQLHACAPSEAKMGFHPRRFPVRVVCTDGSTYTMWSTLPMGTLKLLDDRFSHAEFTEGTEKTDTKRGGQVGRFMARFRGFEEMEQSITVNAVPDKPAVVEAKKPVAPAAKGGDKKKAPAKAPAKPAAAKPAAGAAPAAAKGGDAKAKK